MTERTKQALIAFLTGLFIVEIPVVIEYLVAVPQPDTKILLAGVLGGLLSAVKRWSETGATSVAALHAETYEKVAPPAAMLDTGEPPAP